MLLALAKLRDEVPKFAGEANSAIFRLLTTLPLWEMGPSMPELMLSYLNSAIREGLGVPPDADRGAVAEIIERIANAPDLTGGRLLEPLQIALINICLSLAGCGELNAVLATRPGSREAVILGIQQFSEQFKKEKAMSELYSDSIEYVLEALRTR